ncbi:hypothetical protein Drorol1_Dr00016618 [Drosera rotundifolia]
MKRRGWRREEEMKWRWRFERRGFGRGIPETKVETMQLGMNLDGIDCLSTKQLEEANHEQPSSSNTLCNCVCVDGVGFGVGFGEGRGTEIEEVRRQLGFGVGMG